jgi:uncharacterized FAD-dependent dehydrogenase
MSSSLSNSCFTGNVKAPPVLPDRTVFLLRNTALSLDEDEATLPLRIAARFRLATEALVGFKILRKGIDARKKSRIKYVYTVEFSLTDPERFWEQHHDEADLERVVCQPRAAVKQLCTAKRVVITGSGPAGIFAALRLADYGLAPLLLERGQGIEERVRAVERFWRDGILDEESNVQFGEGGAGTFSDGKLTTRVRDPHTGYVLRRFVEFGAPPEIEWLAKPHIGTDRLRTVLLNIRRFLSSRGVDIRFGAKLTGLGLLDRQVSTAIINDLQEEPCDALLLAPGHSSRDTYAMLDSHGVLMEQKPFAVGLRVEHPQELIDRIQYGAPVDPRLPAADYALAWNDAQSGRSAYSFCMCPGGVVIGGSSESGTVVTNGMSYLQRGSGWANSALVATVKTTDFADNSPLAGINLQRRLEQLAFSLGGSNYRAPAQNLLSFLKKGGGTATVSTYRPGISEADLAELLPGFVTATLRDGIAAFDRKMRGFITAEATLIGVESRTSAPLRIVRGENCQSSSIRGLYPCGEGAGYAGGIMSAALDGIRVADAIAGELA